MPCQRSQPVVPEPQGIYIEPTNICTLKCSGCARTTFINQWPQAWRNHSIDIQDLMRFLDLDLTDKTVLLSGNYGDPIYHPEFVTLVQQLKSHGARLKITTNGNYRNQEWWSQLAMCFDPADMIVFSIDGLPSNFMQYRQNADWPSMLQGIQACVASTAHVAWKYIPFDFNQDNIDQARTVSEDLGFDSFYLDPSKRFDDCATQALQPRADLISPEYHDRVVWKNQTSGAVLPRCATGLEHFITADGYYTPCCYVADHRWLYKTDFGRQRSRYAIAHHTLSEILAQDQVRQFYQQLDQHAVCQFSCPKSQNTI